MATIGRVTRQKDGKFIGKLSTLSFTAPISIEPVGNKEDPKHPDYRIYCKGHDVGAGWKRTGEKSKKEYLSCSVSAPEFGTLYFNLGREAGQDDDDVFALIWNEKQK